jgi:hypothetical protein
MTGPISTELRAAVVQRAQGRCEYCGIPEKARLVRHEVDHIIAGQHRGETTLENLALACFYCNRYKGPNLASIDPPSGDIVRLFNPREDSWAEHFKYSGPEIVPLTAIGRATVALLNLNSSRSLQARMLSMSVGSWKA